MIKELIYIFTIISTIIATYILPIILFLRSYQNIKNDYKPVLYYVTIALNIAFFLFLLSFVYEKNLLFSGAVVVLLMMLLSIVLDYINNCEKCHKPTWQLILLGLMYITVGILLTFDILKTKVDINFNVV